MGVTNIPVPDRELQEQVQQTLDHWINPCFRQPYEHITARANDQGEVWLTGLVEAGDSAKEAVWLVKAMPSVHIVYDLITIVYTGKSVVA